jgi:hypothetical protein
VLVVGGDRSLAVDCLAERDPSDTVSTDDLDFPRTEHLWLGGVAALQNDESGAGSEKESDRGRQVAGDESDQRRAGDPRQQHQQHVSEVTIRSFEFRDTFFDLHPPHLAVAFR